MTRIEEFRHRLRALVEMFNDVPRLDRRYAMLEETSAAERAEKESQYEYEEMKKLEPGLTVSEYTWRKAARRAAELPMLSNDHLGGCKLEMDEYKEPHLIHGIDYPLCEVCKIGLTGQFKRDGEKNYCTLHQPDFTEEERGRALVHGPVTVEREKAAKPHKMTQEEVRAHARVFEEAARTGGVTVDMDGLNGDKKLVGWTTTTDLRQFRTRVYTVKDALDRWKEVQVEEYSLPWDDGTRRLLWVFGSMNWDTIDVPFPGGNCGTHCEPNPLFYTDYVNDQSEARRKVMERFCQHWKLDLDAVGHEVEQLKDGAKYMDTGAVQAGQAVRRRVQGGNHG
jgi:hypothetical protein